jgi:hypothetical protein
MVPSIPSGGQSKPLDAKGRTLYKYKTQGGRHDKEEKVHRHSHGTGIPVCIIGRVYIGNDSPDGKHRIGKRGTCRNGFI